MNVELVHNENIIQGLAPNWIIGFPEV